MTDRRSLLFPLILLVFFFSPLAWAHESRPLYVEITEVQSELFSVNWKVPKSLPDSNIPEPILPESCIREGETLRAKR